MSEDNFFDVAADLKVNKFFSWMYDDSLLRCLRYFLKFLPVLQLQDDKQRNPRHGDSKFY